MTPQGGARALAAAAVGVAAVAALVGTVAVAAGTMWLVAVAWSHVGAGAAGAAAATWAGRHREQPELRLLCRSTAPPGRVTCRHHNLVAPWVVAADCAVCGPISPEDIPPGPVYGGLY